MRGKRYLLFGLMIVLVLSGVPNAECNDNTNIEGVHILEVGGVDPPTIGWVYAPDTNWSVHTTTGAHYDSVYTGQTEMTWPYSNWVNDSDGIDTVFYQYKFGYDEWVNSTPTLLEGNATHGRYSYTMIQSIWWDWEASWPVIEGGWAVSFRIFANDSLGNWRITQPTGRSGGWMAITPPWQYWIPNAIPFIIAFSTIGVLFIAVVIRRRKHVAAV